MAMMNTARMILSLLVIGVACHVGAFYVTNYPCRKDTTKSFHPLRTKCPSLSATIEKIEKTDEEWKEQLSPEEFYVLREAGTERPNSSELNYVKEAGTFVCRGCGAPLFTTSTKFDSGTGWPSFYQPIDRDAVYLKMDYKLLLPRNEVCCAKCEGHLGHVFDDGPEPTGQRYCMNGVAMDFRSDQEDPEIATIVAMREKAAPFKPTVDSQIPGILLNGGIGMVFFASVVSRIDDVGATGGTPSPLDFAGLIPAIFYGVLAMRGMSRLLEGPR